MFINNITISRLGQYSWDKPDPTKPFQATVGVYGQNGKVELILSETLSRRVVEIIADEIAAAGRATAEAMTAEALTVAALPAPEPAR